MPRKAITFNGESLTIPQWAKRYNLSARNVRYRLKAGWTIEDALTAPHTGIGRPNDSQRVRIHRRRQTAADLLARDFTWLVQDIDHALRKFRDRLERRADHTPGVVESIEEMSNDRAIPPMQDSV